MKNIALTLLLLWGMVISPIYAVQDCMCPCECEQDEENIEYSSDILINEMLPNPAGSETEGEWIELKNNGSEDVDLCGWQIKDASTKIYTIAAEDFDSTIVAAGDYFVIARAVSALALNNTGDEVNLYQPDENLIETIQYNESAEEDYTYARDDADNWDWTSKPTPGSENYFEVAVEPIEQEQEESDNQEPEPAEEEEEEDVAVYDYSDQIIINEIYADPISGETEFIELKNKGGEQIDLNGWKVSDATSKTYIISAEDYTSTIIDKYFVINKDTSGISLNNSGDSVELFWADDSLVDLVEYSGGSKGQSYSLKNSEWDWTDKVTPGADNEIKINKEEENNDKETSEKEDESIEYDYSSKIEITELLPDPEGADSTDEFIEIYNGDENNINLIGWNLTDGSRTFSWKEKTIIKSNQYKVFYITETKISLNNSGETIKLLNPKEKVISEVVYDKATAGQSYAKDEGQWLWSMQTTPGEDNIIQTESEETESADAAEAEDENNNEYQAMSITEARGKEKNDKVIIEGVVSVEPGVLGTQFFYVEDSEAGIQVYSSKKYFPDGMKVGDQVVVQGKISEASNEKKLNISTAEDIEIIGAGSDIEAVEVEEIGEDLEGKLVTAESQILELASNKISLVNEILVYIKSGVEFSKSDYSEGDIIRVTGIVGQYKEDYRLMPRSKDDIEIVKVNSEAEKNNTLLGSVSADKNDTSSWFGSDKKNNQVIYYLIAGVLLLIIIILAVIYKTGIWKEWIKKISTLVVDDEKNTTVKDARSQYRG